MAAKLDMKKLNKYIRYFSLVTKVDYSSFLQSPANQIYCNGGEIS